MRTVPFLLSLLSLSTMAGFVAPGAQGEDQAPGHRVIEVALFQVDRDSYATKEAERAGSIPDEMLEAIQRAILGQLTRSGDFTTARKPTDQGAEPGGFLLLTGRVTDFKPGSRAARHFVGFGAGKQLIEVECVLRDQATGQVLAEGRVIDRKVGGWGGGSELKGVEDFAEKVLDLIRDALRSKETK